ncbi:hypothetical protein [Shimia ponticola]|uniref:hypothetical protein n=1 Tax=Shimia ponticola TaxID=2582893 RepID=UPI0011BE4AF0|nr:hypothetical protein [Shimia ponticola]
MTGTRVYSQAKAGLDHDIQMHLRHGDPAVTTEVLGHEDFTHPNLEPPRLDVGHMRSPGKVGEEINAPRPAVQYEIALQDWAGHASHDVFRTLEASGEVIEFLLTKDGTLRGWAAKVMYFDPTDAGMRDKGMAVLKLSIMAEIETPAPIS